MSTHFHRVTRFAAPSADRYYTSLLKLFGTVVATKLEGFVSEEALQQIYNNLGPGMWSLVKSLTSVTIVKRLNDWDDYPRFRNWDKTDGFNATKALAEKVGIKVDGIIYWLSCSIQGNSFAVIAEQKVDSDEDLDVIYLVEYLPREQMTNTEKQVQPLLDEAELRLVEG